MQFLKSTTAWILCIFALANLASAKPSRADFALVASTGGYLGRYTLGAGVISETESHRAALTLGYTPDDLIGEIYQLNINYIFAPWRFPVSRRAFLEPLGVGLMVMGTNHESYSLGSSDVFHQGDYDQTAIRAGLLFAAALRGHIGDFNIHGGPFVSLLDPGITRLVNNGWSDAVLDFMSLGFALSIY